MVQSGEVWVDRLLADQPVVHAMNATDNPALGLWSTDRDCYLYLAEFARPGTFSLETGAGLSTVLMAALGASHICITPLSEEIERLREYCSSKDIDLSNVTFETGASCEVLPRLPRDLELDLVLIDGSHGFPEPIVDWFYASSHLRDSGVLVIDDTHLPAVAQVCKFLDRDPRFELQRRTEKWVAYRRVGSGSLRQDWFDQPFLGTPSSRLGQLKHVLGQLRRRVRTRRGSSHHFTARRPV